MNGKVYAGREKIDRVTALKMATVWASEYVLKEKVLGSLEPGKLGDLLVLNRDYFTVPEGRSARWRRFLRWWRARSSTRTPR